ncbi:hypothetical protein EYF80_063747 [Liparis tanakae]|uniref:Uncharacterized protein n=1 Tax=Liparis tanakae TaxID=230148 RepID=A0A4Z2EBA0_9TELE|nr:hypothetical protein EYF80_063747 [Liparis tanakae]
MSSFSSSPLQRLHSLLTAKRKTCPGGRERRGWKSCGKRKNEKEEEEEEEEEEDGFVWTECMSVFPSTGAMTVGFSVALLVTLISSSSH